MAETTTQEAPLDELDVFVGEWIMTTSLAPDSADAPLARASFEWLTGKRFLVQRWEVEHPDALERYAAAPDFSQRFTGTFDHDRNTIVGSWESSSDSSNWKPDFDLTYTRTQ